MSDLPQLSRADVDPQASWSSTFARHRAEVVFFALLIALAAFGDLDLTKIPGLGIEVKGFSLGVGLAFLYGFFLYFLAAMFFRARVEIASSGLPSQLLRQYQLELHETVHQATHATMPDANGAITALQVAWGRMSPSKPDRADDRLQISLNRLFARWDTSMDSMVRREARPSSEELQTVLSEQVKQGIDAVRDALKQSSIEWNNTIVELDARYKVTKEEIDTHATKALLVIGSRSEGIVAYLSQINKTLARLDDNIRSLRSALTWDKRVLGYYIPVAFSLMIVLASTPRAWGYMSADNALASCLRGGLSACIEQLQTPNASAPTHEFSSH